MKIHSKICSVFSVPSSATVLCTCSSVVHSRFRTNEYDCWKLLTTLLCSGSRSVLASLKAAQAIASRSVIQVLRGEVLRTIQGRA